VKRLWRKLGDGMLRLLRADPDVFRPVARAHRLITHRMERVARGRARGFMARIPPAYFLRFMAAFYGTILSNVFAWWESRVFGAALLLTFGGLFLILVVILDYYDVLVNRDEYLVLASHPHDTWSILLAKIMVVGQSILVLGACYFVPGAIRAAFSFRSPVAGLGFLVGAAGLTVAVGAGGMLITALLVRIGGRAAIQRVLPLIQAAFVLSVMFGSGAGRVMRTIAVPKLAEIGFVQWALPPFWFVWPVELATGQVSGGTLLRAGLSAISLIAVAVVGSGWIADRFGERLLEPEARSRSRVPKPARSRARTRAPLRPRFTLLGDSPELRGFLTIARAHVRGDTQLRTQILISCLLPVGVLGSAFLRGRHFIMNQPTEAMLLLGLGFMMATGPLTQALMWSSRPAALWCVLASPIDRSQFSLATIRVLRVFFLGPFFLGLGVLAWIVARTKGAGIAMAAIELTLLCDLMLAIWRGFSSAFPFSRPVGLPARRSGATILTVFVTMAFGGLGLTMVLLSDRAGIAGQLSAVALFLIVRYFVGKWVTGRISREAAALEIGAESIPRD